MRPSEDTVRIDNISLTKVKINTSLTTIIPKNAMGITVKSKKVTYVLRLFFFPLEAANNIHGGVALATVDWDPSVSLLEWRLRCCSHGSGAVTRGEGLTSIDDYIHIFFFLFLVLVKELV